MIWTLKQSGATIARVLSCAADMDATKIVSKLYNGSWHVQTVGAARGVLSLQLYVDSRAARDTVNAAAAQAAVLTVAYRDSTYTGIIEGAVAWSPFVGGKSYTGTCKLLEVT